MLCIKGCLIMFLVQEVSADQCYFTLISFPVYYNTLKYASECNL